MVVEQVCGSSSRAVPRLLLLALSPCFSTFHRGVRNSSAAGPPHAGRGREGVIALPLLVGLGIIFALRPRLFASNTPFYEVCLFDWTGRDSVLMGGTAILFHCYR